MTYRDYVNTQFNEEEDRYLPSGYLGEFEIKKSNKNNYPILLKEKNGLEYRIKNNFDSSIKVFDGNKEIGYADNKAIMVAPTYQKKGIGLELVSILKKRNPNHRFGSMTPEGFNLMGKYYDTYIANNPNIQFEKGGLIAPNGKPSNLNPIQYKLVRTKAFKDWFGDWEKAYITKNYKGVSKIIDENGEPLVCSHRTNENFTIFDIKKSGTKTDTGYFGKGFYFSPNIIGNKTYGERLLKVFLNVKNPKYTYSYNLQPNNKIATIVVKGEYDFINNTKISVDKINEIQEIVVFDSNQIKLADGTNTTFDFKNDDIRYNEGGILTEYEKEKIFKKGYGKIKKYIVTNFGLSTEYYKNPNMTRSQQNTSPTFIIPATNEMILKASQNKKKYEALQPKEISILEFAKKVAKANKGKIYHRSKSGSVYIRIGDKTIRISDHFILDRDALNPKLRYDVEIVRKVFYENDEPNINFNSENDDITYNKGGYTSNSYDWLFW